MELYPAIGDEEWVRNEFINVVITLSDRLGPSLH